MYFKPRIFISSTMGDKLKLRNAIKKIFEDTGAEVALYEKDLTPSVATNTYRGDILQTDFVIFIIDERYGAITDTGVSGTEEEFNIAIYNKKPCHVYLKKIDKTDAAKRFENLIKSKGISYYYYDTEADLKKKLKSTCFTIAHDIVFANIDRQKIDPVLVHKMAIQHDVKIGKPFCQLMEETLEINNKTNLDFINSNLLISTLDIAIHSILAESKSIFIDRKCDDLLKNLCQQILEFNKRMANESCPNSIFAPINFMGGGNINISMNQWSPNVDFNWYNSQFQSIINAYSCYKDYLAQMLLVGEIYNNS